MNSDQHPRAVLRERYKKEIEKREVEIKELEAKLKALEELEQEIAVQAQDDRQLPLFGAKTGKYVTSSLIDAIFDAVLEIARQFPEMPVQRNNVADFLKSNGYHSTGKNFRASVDTTLRRLAGAGRIATSRTPDGERVYSRVALSSASGPEKPPPS